MADSLREGFPEELLADDPEELLMIARYRERENLRSRFAWNLPPQTRDPVAEAAGYARAALRRDRSRMEQDCNILFYGTKLKLK